MNHDPDPTAAHPPQPWVRLAGEDDDASINSYELFSARRALNLLKGRLGRDRLLELLADEIAAGNVFLRDHLARSAGQEATGTIVLHAHGISAEQFTGWLSRAFGREDVMLAGHPEHYSIHTPPGGNVNIVETLHDKVCSFFMRAWDDSLVGPSPVAAQDVPDARRSHLTLDDGTLVGSIANSFRDNPEGFSAHLSVTLPATCAPDVIDQHLEHFAVEFRTWILTAADELAAATPAT